MKRRVSIIIFLCLCSYCFSVSKQDAGELILRAKSYAAKLKGLSKLNYFNKQDYDNALAHIKAAEKNYQTSNYSFAVNSLKKALLIFSRMLNMGDAVLEYELNVIPHDDFELYVKSYVNMVCAKYTKAIGKSEQKRGVYLDYAAKASANLVSSRKYIFDGKYVKAYNMAREAYQLIKKILRA